MKTIQWLVNLEKGKLVVAVLLIATVALFTQNQVKERQKDELNKAYREELIRRADSCEVEKLRIVQEDRQRMEDFLKSLLEKSKKTERDVDSAVLYNKRVISRTKKFLSNE